MAKILVLAEKPSLRRDLEKVWPKNGDTVDFANFVGHTMMLQLPEDYDAKYQKWDKTTLPILPDQFKYKPIDSAKKIVSELNSKIKSGGYDYVVNACDAAREGELIFWSFYAASAHKPEVKRLWAQDTTDEGLKKAIANLIPQTEPSLVLLQESARLRAEMDWLFGINFTRAFSISTNQKTPIGRVKTPTLKMIVDRELAIRDFKPEKFYEAEVILTKDAIDFSALNILAPDFKSTRIDKRADAQAVLDGLKAGLKVLDVNTEENKQYAPTLYSLTELQKDANSYFGYTAAETLSIAQSLYENKKLLTYPRTECRYIPKNMVAEIPKKLSCAGVIPELATLVSGITQATISSVLGSKKYVDDAKLTDHHAIVPTNKMPVLSDLSDKEKNIYTLVAKRLVALFLGPYVTDKTVATFISSSNKRFLSRGKVDKDKGYSILYKSKNTDVIMPPLSAGEIVSIKDKAVIEKETTPPKRFNDRTILEAMVNAGSQIKEKDLRDVLRESSGIGTTATRAAIIDSIFENGWAERRGKTIYATDLGIKVIETLGSRDICSPKITAEWETKLRNLESGSGDPNLVSDLNTYVKSEVDSLLKTTTQLGSGSGAHNREYVGTCPKCGGQVYVGKNGYLCEAYKNTCDFYISKEVLGAKISTANIKAFLSGKEVKKKLTFQDGRKSEKELYINSDGKLVYKKTIVTEAGKCPACDGSLKIVGKTYRCDCGFWALHTFSGHEVTVDELTRLYHGELLRNINFISAKGTPYIADLSLTGGKYQLDLAAEGDGERVGTCPKCGGNVMSTRGYYMCDANPHSCDFKISHTICGASISISDAKTLLAGGETDAKKMSFKDGKTAVTALKLDKDNLKFLRKTSA